MIGLFFHVLYLLGKCIYDKYRTRKTVLLPDVASEVELFKDDDSFDDNSELEDTSWWTHRTIGNFYPPAYIQRYSAVADVLNEHKGKLWKIVDFGCAELSFVRYLKAIPEVEHILCVDVDKEILERYKSRAAPLITEMLTIRQRKLTIEMCEGSVTDNDIKLKHANAVICIELIEHLYPDTLIDLPFNIFGYIKPEIVIITTPNVEYNVVFPHLSGYRHVDHKFEWTRKQFQDWAQNIVVRYPYYSVSFHGICEGPEGTEELGALTQMAVFYRTSPRNESRLKILIPDEYIQLRGQQSLFNTVAIYHYSTRSDVRSDEQKILDEATYYINYLSYNMYDEEEPRKYEINLNQVLTFMPNYTISIETLKLILTNAGWSVIDQEDGPFVLYPSPASTESDPGDGSYMDDIDNDWGNEYEDSNEDLYNSSTNMENIWDYATGSPIDEISVDANEVDLSEQNLHTENWSEESNVTNEENRSDYLTNPPVNEIPADANEVYLSQQNPYTASWHEESNIINEENRLDQVTNPSINETSADTNEEYLSEQNLHTDSWHEESNITNEENRSDYVTNPLIDGILTDENEYLSEQNPHTDNLRDHPYFTDDDKWDYESGMNDILVDIDEEYLSTQNLNMENLSEETNFTNVMNKWDYESSSSVNQVDANEEYSFAQNPHVENWHEELSIIIPENCSINQENTYLFDGENSLIEESHPSKATYDDVKHLEVRNAAESLIDIKQELPSSIPLTLNDIEVKAEVIASNMFSTALNNSLQLETSDNDVTTEINVRTMQEVTSILNFQPHMSISRSSTSPGSLNFYYEKNNSLQDLSSYYQNELSINNQYLLNSTFHQITTETVINAKESTTEDIPCFKKNLPKKDTQESEINFSLHMPPNYNCNVQQGRNISDKNQICEDNDMADVMSSDSYSNFNNQLKYTSSPHTKMSTTNIVSKKNLKCRDLMPAMNSNVSLNTTEKIKETVSDTIDSILLKTSQKFNNSTIKTIKLYTPSSSSDITNIHNVDFSTNNSTQEKLYLENNEFSDVNNSISTELIQDTNQEFVQNDISHESDVVDDVRNVDKCHVLSLGNESSNHKDKNVYCTLAKTDLTKAHLENVVSDPAQSSIRKKNLNSPKELLSSKSQSVCKYSSPDCAKEISILRNDKFVPCKSSEDTSNVYLTSIIKNEETVGTSKDISNIAGLVNNYEAKPTSPLETPPNSWSPEIMDSGYPNSVSAQDITPEYELPSIAQDYIPDSESPSIAEAPRLGVLEPIEVENGDLANNNRDDEGNNMMAVDANNIENLQPLIDVLENDLENENDIYVMQNGFPIWLLRILDMANPLDFDMQVQQNLIIPDEIADDPNYVGRDEGFDSSSESESDIVYNEMENDNKHK